MTGADFRMLMETILPDALLSEVANATGFHQRDRKRDAIKFLRTMSPPTKRGPISTEITGHHGPIGEDLDGPLRAPSDA